MSKKYVLFVMRYTIPDKENQLSDYHPKFDDQISAMRSLGFVCINVAVGKDGVYYIIDGEKHLFKRIKKMSAFFYHYQCYKEIYNLAVFLSRQYKIEMAYIRNCPTVFTYIKMMKNLKKNVGNVVVEIPTYPSKDEVKASKKISDKLFYPYLSFIEKQASKYVDLFVLIGKKADTFRGKKAINIINGTNISGYKAHSKRNPDGFFHIICLAGMNHYHGFDRLILSLIDYYERGNVKNVFIHLVGPDVDGSLSKWMKMANNSVVSGYVLEEGPMRGKALDDMFDKCDFACGSLGLFRKKMRTGFDLKCAEYMSRGIPFICCNFTDSFFSNIPHCYSKVSEDESLISFDDIYNFMSIEALEENATEDLRNYAKKLNWESQFSKILDNLRHNDD